MEQPDPAALTGIAGFVADVVQALGPVGVGLLVALENVFPPIPSEVVLPLSGFLAGQGRMSLGLTVAAATLGSVVGALLLYWAGAALGRPGWSGSPTACRWWAGRTSSALRSGSTGAAAERCSSAGWCRWCAA